MIVEVTSDDPRNSGDASYALFSPKLSIAYAVSPNLEIYANGGRGFHSNDARGATIKVDPNTGAAAERVPLLVPSTGAELGARWETGDFSATAAVWWLSLDSELVFVGDAGTTEPSDATERHGVEVLFDWRPIPRLHLDFSAAATHARFPGVAAGTDRIPNALEYVATGGVSALVTEAFTATMTVRHLGAAPLIEDNSVRSRSATIVNALLRYRLGRFDLTGEVLNLFNTAADDIQYFYTSRLFGETAGGFDDRHFHPAEPRSLRISLRTSF
jgi:outer membrane receptor protein involved in Fe transport